MRVLDHISLGLIEKGRGGTGILSLVIFFSEIVELVYTINLFI